MCGMLCISGNFLEVEIESGSNGIIEHPHCDKPNIGMFGVSDIPGGSYYHIYCHYRVTGSPWQNGGSMLSPNQNHSYRHRMDFPLQPLLLLSCHSSMVADAVSSQEYCHPLVL